MGIQQIIQRIEKESEEKANSIIASAEQEAAKIIEEALKEAKKRCLELEEANKRKCELVRNNILSQASHEVKKKLLLAKEELIKEGFGRASELFKQLDEKEYRQLLGQLLKKGKELVGEDCVVIPARDKDRDFIKKLGYEVSPENCKGSGGVILRSKDGSILIDNTYEGIIKRNWSNLRIKVAELLFSGEKEE
jgi:V/A-type H+-transporting ATPase subunit E